MKKLLKTLEMINLHVKYEYPCLEEDVEEIYRQAKDCWKLMDEVFMRVVG